MAQVDSPPILVGVDGTAEGLRAVDFAAAEALRVRCPIELVHVFRELPTTLLATHDVLTSREGGRAALDEAKERLAGLVATAGPPLAVRTCLIWGSARDELPRTADGARMLVIGRSPLHGVERFLAGSVATKVCARSSVPVVSVPLSWRGAPGKPVVVGVIDESSDAALSMGFAQAQLLGVPLRVVRAWDPPATWITDAPVSPEEIEESWVADTERTLSEELAGWRATYPFVPVEQMISVAAAGRALVDAAEDAQLVVVAARRSMELLHPRLGSTARKLLAHAVCPVIVAPARHRERQPAREATSVDTAAPGIVMPL